jgi:hypothetical protein
MRPNSWILRCGVRAMRRSLQKGLKAVHKPGITSINVAARAAVLRPRERS